jgi:hypothetical protein
LLRNEITTDSDERDSHAYGATHPDRQPDRDRQYVSGESGVGVLRVRKRACNRNHEGDEGEQIPQGHTPCLRLLGHSIGEQISRMNERFKRNTKILLSNTAISASDDFEKIACSLNLSQCSVY